MHDKKKFITNELAIDELLKRSLIYKMSDQYKKFFKFIASFDHYSYYNSSLVFHQDDSVTFYGGIAFWRDRKRTIKDDARKYIILVPKGPIMVVYDIFSTEGDQTPKEVLENGLGRKPFKTDGFINTELFDYAINLATRLGIKLTNKPLSYLSSGYITTIEMGRLEICFEEKQTIHEKFGVLIHELAHLFLGHCKFPSLIHAETNKQISLPQRGNLTKATQELEAETTCYLITTKLGLTKNSEEYLANFLHPSDDFAQFSYETVIKTADKLEGLFIKPKFRKDQSLDVFNQR